jgi:hypothetical protein
VGAAAGLIDAEWKLSENKQRARYYPLTTKGKKALALQETRLESDGGCNRASHAPSVARHGGSRATIHSKLGVGTSNERAHHRVHTRCSVSPNPPTRPNWRWHNRSASHSSWSARIGSTLVARSAGIRLAITATTMRKSAAPAMLMGSAGLT